MNARDRIHRYYNFDPAVLEAVEHTAEQHQQESFTTLATSYGVVDGPLRSTPLYKGHDIEYVPFEARVKDETYDTTRAKLLFTPMAIPADQSQIARAIPIAAAHPRERLLLFGNPAAIGNRANRLRFVDMPAVWRGNLQAVAKPILQQLQREGITTVDTMGYSYGAEVAAAVSAEAHEFGITVERGVWAEPVAIANRGVGRLLKDFKRSEAPLAGYIAQTHSRALTEARQQADTGFARYAGGLLRASNLAIAHALAGSSFAERAKQALATQPTLQATIAWGSASEITGTQQIRPIVQQLTDQFGPARVRQMNLIDMHHAGGDDIDLHAAIMLQGLRP